MSGLEADHGARRLSGDGERKRRSAAAEEVFKTGAANR